MGKRKNVQNDFIGSKRSYARISLKVRLISNLET